MRFAGPILVASNLSRESDEALRQGAFFAREAGDRLVVCHVLPELFSIRPLFPQLHAQDREEIENARQSVTGLVERQLDRVLEPAAPKPEIRLESGSPHTVVLQVAAEVEAGLIVLGRRSRSDGHEPGGVSERIARHARCPVLVAVPGGGGAVLAATDFSDASLPAVRRGYDEAQRRSLPFVIVHSIDLRMASLNLPEVVSASLIDRVMEARREEARDQLAEIASGFGGAARTILREDPPVDAIVGLADEIRAELIVTGTHGRSGLGRLALGSVAEGVLRRARCSVLVVRLGDQ
jgi:nucleotide-binding universal stress UspA family protein